MPVEPLQTPWAFPHPEDFPESDLVAVGADLAPGTLLAAYRRGIFPMPGELESGELAWFSPVKRGVLPLDRMKVSRSLRRSCERFEIRVDTAFAEVIAACGDPGRAQGWIDADIVEAYQRLHELGWAHSVETWEGDELVGGLYGVEIGGLFAGESMFHRRTDASKVALVGLVERLRRDRPEQRLLDVQWRTRHLGTLGVVEVRRGAYLAWLHRALALPPVIASGIGEPREGP